MSKEKTLLKLDQIPEEERERKIQEYRAKIEQLEKGFSDEGSLFYEVATMQKQNLVVKMAEYHENLWKLGASDVPPQEIANFLVKRFATLKLKIHPSTVYDNLPPRFKSHTPNPKSDELETNSENPNDNSSLNIKPEEENADWIECINNQIDFLRSFRTKLSTSSFTSKLSEIAKKELQETLGHINASVRIANKIFDDRQSVPVEFQHFLAASFMHQTNNFAAGLYISQVKDYGANRSKEARQKLKKLADLGEKFEKEEDTMTSKQAMKIILGYVKKVAPIFEPKNRNEALATGVYYGTQCPNSECNSWRVFLDSEGANTFCRCYACDTTFEAKTATRCKKCYLPLYDEVLASLRNSAEYIEESAAKVTCPNEKCGHEMIMPVKLLHETVIFS